MNFSKLGRRLIRSDWFLACLITVLIGAAVAGGLLWWMVNSRSNAKLEAQALVGEHVIVNGKWFMFAGYSELYTADGKTIQVPTNTVYGSRIADYFLGLKAVPKMNYRIRVAYMEQPQNIWPDNSYTRDYMAGAYLNINEVDEREKPIASEPLASNQ